MRTDVDHLFRLADTAHRAGKFDTCHQLCQDVLKTDPGHVPTLILLSANAAKSGQMELSTTLLRKALEVDPDSNEAIKGLSVLERRNGNLPEAFALAQRSVQLSPSDPEAHNNLGLCLLAYGRLEESADAFQDAIKLNPELGQVQHNLAQAFQKMGRSEEAIQALREAVRLNPRSVNSLLSLGNLLVRQGDFLAAVRLADQALAIAPEWAPAHYLKSQALSGANLGEEAEAELRRTLDLEPENSTVHRMLGFLLQSKGDWQGARQSFETSLTLQPCQGLSFLGLVRGEKVRAEDLSLLQRMSAAAQEPRLSGLEGGYIHYALGKAYDDLAEYGAAMRHYDLANKMSLESRAPAARFSPSAYAAHVDQVIEQFTPDLFAKNTIFGNESETPILIVGMMRSGTTLVEQIVSSHPEVGAGGELRFWMEQGHRAFDKFGAPLSDQMIDLAGEYLELLREVSPGHARVTDKMPANFQMLGLIHAVFPKARIIHVMRHPADNCISIYNTPYSVSPDFGHDRDNIVFAYRQYQRLMEHWRTVLPPGAILDVHYEELVEDKERVVRQMIDHCRLGWSDACLSHEVNGRLVNTPSVWQVRQPVYKTSVNRWQRYEPWLGSFRQLI